MVVLNNENGKTPDRDEELITIIVAGVSSGAGKTSVAEVVTALLADRGRTAAAKITVTHGERGCPHGGKGCNVCSSLGGDFQVIDSPSIINQPQTDTARLSLAGAEPVLWAITRADSLKAAWQAMCRRMNGVRCAVIETNSLREHLSPALTLMIVDPSVSRRIWKPSAERLIAAADYLIFNDRGTQEKRTACLAEIKSLRGTTDHLIYVTHPHQAGQHPEITASLQNISEIKS